MEKKKCEYCGDTFVKTERVARNWSKMRFCSIQCRGHAADARRRNGAPSKAERMAQWARDRQEFVDDVRLLMVSDSPPNIERRLGMSMEKIREKLRRHGHNDLADQLLEEEERYGVVRGFRTTTHYCA